MASVANQAVRRRLLEREMELRADIERELRKYDEEQCADSIVPVSSRSPTC